MNKIYVVRDQKIMLDRDLTELYGVETKVLKQAVLSSERAIHVNIRIIRIYTRIREMLLLHKNVSFLVEQVEKKLAKQDQKIEVLLLI